MKKYNLSLIIFILAAMFFIGQAWAAEDIGRSDTIERTVVISAKEMTRKSGTVTINNTQFFVDKNTVIIDTRGIKISLIELMVPVTPVSPSTLVTQTRLLKKFAFKGYYPGPHLIYRPCNEEGRPGLEIFSLSHSILPLLLKSGRFKRRSFYLPWPWRYRNFDSERLPCKYPPFFQSERSNGMKKRQLA